MLAFQKLLTLHRLYTVCCKTVDFPQTVGFLLSVLCLLQSCWLFKNYWFCILVCTLSIVKLLAFHKLSVLHSCLYSVYV